MRGVRKLLTGSVYLLSAAALRLHTYIKYKVLPPFVPNSLFMGETCEAELALMFHICRQDVKLEQQVSVKGRAGEVKQQEISHRKRKVQHCQQNVLLIHLACQFIF